MHFPDILLTSGSIRVCGSRIRPPYTQSFISECAVKSAAEYFSPELIFLSSMISTSIPFQASTIHKAICLHRLYGRAFLSLPPKLLYLRLYFPYYTQNPDTERKRHSIITYAKKGQVLTPAQKSLLIIYPEHMRSLTRYGESKKDAT
jgi:hypothetical protein